MRSVPSVSRASCGVNMTRGNQEGTKRKKTHQAHDFHLEGQQARTLMQDSTSNQTRQQDALGEKDRSEGRHLPRTPVRRLGPDG